MPSLCNERTSMVGGGYYNENSSLQALVAEECAGLVSRIDCQGDSVAFADYGCSEGSNSIRLIRRAIDLCAEGSSITLVFNDTPANDFTSLSATIDRSLRGSDHKSSKRLYPHMAPQSYYQQVVPDESIDIGFSTATLHWISRLQPTSEDILPDSADISAEVLSDILCFLRNRHREIRRGGHLLLSFPVDGEPSLKCAYPSIYKAIVDLAQDGVIPQAAAAKFRFPFHFRTAEEISQTLNKVKGDWEVLQHFERDVPHPAYFEFQSTLAHDSTGIPNAAALDTYSKKISSGFVAIIGNTVVDTARRFRDVGARMNSAELIRKRLAEKLQHHLRESDFWTTPLGNKYVFLKLRKI